MGTVVPVLRYLWQIWWKIPGSWKQRKRILSCAAVPVRDYAERNPHAGYDGLIQRFGTPTQVAESCLADMDVEELSKQLNIRKKIVAIVAATAVVIVALWAGAVTIALAEERIHTNISVIEEIDVVECRPISSGGE